MSQSHSGIFASTESFAIFRDKHEISESVAGWICVNRGRGFAVLHVCHVDVMS